MTSTMGSLSEISNAVVFGHNTPTDISTILSIIPSKVETTPMNYAKLFTKRKDGSYQAKYKDSAGKWRTISNADPEKLYKRLEALKNPPAVTVGQIVDAWEAEHGETVSYRTRVTYIAPIRRIKERFGDAPAAELAPGDIQNFLNELARQRYSRRSVLLHRGILSMSYQRALVQGDVARNPVIAVSIPRGLSTGTRSVPDDDALTAIRTRTDAEFSSFALLLLYTGLRRGEALALRQEDVDRKARIIHVRRAIQFQPNAPVVGSTKTGTSVRDVHFPPALLKVLPKSKGPLFPAPDGKSYLSREQFLYRWKKYCEAIGYDITPHQLRHYYSTAMYEAGVPVLAAQAQLGHKNASTTMNIYTHLRDQKKQEAYDQIDSYFSSKEGKKQRRSQP